MTTFGAPWNPPRSRSSRAPTTSPSTGATPRSVPPSPAAGSSPCTTEPVGTGQVADTVRLQLTYDDAGTPGPATLVAKVPAADETSRAGARFSRTYEIEASFYRDLAPILPVRTPNCHHAAHDPETDGYVVLLEDVAPARQGDQMDGCPVPDIAAAIDELVLLQGPRWGDETLLEIPWLHRSSPEAIDGTGRPRHATPSVRSRSTTPSASTPTPWRSSTASCRDSTASCGAGPDRGRSSTGTSGPTTCCSAANGSSSSTGRPSGWARAVRSQLPARGQPHARRPRAHEATLVDRYVQGLVDQGVDVDRDHVWEQYRRYSFGGLIMAIVASFLVQRTDRGDEMFLTMARAPCPPGPRPRRRGIDRVPTHLTRVFPATGV